MYSRCHDDQRHDCGVFKYGTGRGYVQYTSPCPLFPPQHSLDAIDILAPGVGVLSTWNNGSTAIISGTSMSAPHVAGLGAYLLGAGLAEVESLCEAIQGLALKNVVTLLPNGTANLLANNGVDRGG
jgi:hypothetical protein